MPNQNIASFIEDYDAGNRSPLLSLKVYTAVTSLLSGFKEQPDYIIFGDMQGAALENAIEWLRRKLPESVTV